MCESARQSTVIVHLVDRIDEDHEALLAELVELRVRFAEDRLERAPELLEAARNLVLTHSEALVPQPVSAGTRIFTRKIRTLVAAILLYSM